MFIWNASLFFQSYTWTCDPSASHLHPHPDTVSKSQLDTCNQSNPPLHPLQLPPANRAFTTKPAWLDFWCRVANQEWTGDKNDAQCLKTRLPEKGKVRKCYWRLSLFSNTNTDSACQIDRHFYNVSKFDDLRCWLYHVFNYPLWFCRARGDDIHRL